MVGIGTYGNGGEIMPHKATVVQAKRQQREDEGILSRSYVSCNSVTTSSPTGCRRFPLGLQTDAEGRS